jgi:hypothetical protein
MKKGTMSILTIPITFPAKSSRLLRILASSLYYLEKSPTTTA